MNIYCSTSMTQKICINKACIWVSNETFSSEQHILKENEMMYIKILMYKFSW